MLAMGSFAGHNNEAARDHWAKDRGTLSRGASGRSPRSSKHHLRAEDAGKGRDGKERRTRAEGAKATIDAVLGHEEGGRVGQESDVNLVVEGLVELHENGTSLAKQALRLGDRCDHGRWAKRSRGTTFGC